MYFYKSGCPYCEEVSDIIAELSKNETVYAVSCDIEKNRGKKYDWSKSIHDKKVIGYVDEQGNYQFYDGENEEKYLNSNILNDYGNKMYYKVYTETDELEEGKENVCVKMITPEIEYALVKEWKDLIIAGAPTLLHITNGSIDKFYFDSPDIKNLYINFN